MTKPTLVHVPYPHPQLSAHLYSDSSPRGLSIPVSAHGLDLLPLPEQDPLLELEVRGEPTTATLLHQQWLVLARPDFQPVSGKPWADARPSRMLLSLGATLTGTSFWWVPQKAHPLGSLLCLLLRVPLHRRVLSPFGFPLPIELR